ncbi:MAG: hypothetical protein OXG68_02630 [Chloroflexi bacterium]|nr:hypothetical protein [Chloroflexota bacterium]
MPLPSDIRLEFPLQNADSERIDSLLADRGIDVGKPIICIHPGSGASSKLWLAEKWAAVADAMSGDYDAEIVFTGTAGDTAMIEDIEACSGPDILDTKIRMLREGYAATLPRLLPASGSLGYCECACTDSPHQ